MSSVVFRTDASLNIGTGHVMRCLAMAEVLRDQGTLVFFICRLHKGNLCDLIKQRGFDMRSLPAPVSDFHREVSPTYTEWLGASWQDDMEQTRAVIAALDVKPDWLVVDHYALDEHWEKGLRPFVTRILAIDDLADRQHDCDLLLDQNLVENMKDRYKGRVTDCCKLLLGPRYVLLQGIYADLHERLPPREGPIRHILIFFGGIDDHNLTGLALQAFLNLRLHDVNVDVVVRPGPHNETIRTQANKHSNVHLYFDLPSLAFLIAKADLSIGACGTTSWERLCLGLPSLVVTVSENQKPIAESLHHRGLIRWLGHQNEVELTDLQKALAEQISRGEVRNVVWSQNCRAVVNGRGAIRVQTIMFLNPNSPLTARYARFSDEMLLLEWANDLETRKNAFTTEVITPIAHHCWFGSKLRDVEKCRIFIIETSQGIPIGQVRFEKKGDVWNISYSLAQEFRGRGLGRRLLEVALLKQRVDQQCALVMGRVKLTNIASRNIFESLGFSPDSSRRVEGVIEYRRVL